MEAAILIVASASLIVSVGTLATVLFIAHEAKGEIDNTKSSVESALGRFKTAVNQIQL